MHSGGYLLVETELSMNKPMFYSSVRVFYDCQDNGLKAIETVGVLGCDCCLRNYALDKVTPCQDALLRFAKALIFLKAFF